MLKYFWIQVSRHTSYLLPIIFLPKCFVFFYSLSNTLGVNRGIMTRMQKIIIRQLNSTMKFSCFYFCVLLRKFMLQQWCMKNEMSLLWLTRNNIKKMVKNNIFATLPTFFFLPQCKKILKKKFSKQQKSI